MLAARLDRPRLVWFDRLGHRLRRHRVHRHRATAVQTTVPAAPARRTLLTTSAGAAAQPVQRDFRRTFDPRIDDARTGAARRITLHVLVTPRPSAVSSRQPRV